MLEHFFPIVQMLAESSLTFLATMKIFITLNNRIFFFIPKFDPLMSEYLRVRHRKFFDTYEKDLCTEMIWFQIEYSSLLNSKMILIIFDCIPDLDLGEQLPFLSFCSIKFRLTIKKKNSKLRNILWICICH